VADAEIARLNEQFLAHHGPTDVITFQHGEILISIERAIAQARRFGTAVHDELALYLIHGLLHLAGYDDTTPAKRRVMHARQRALLGEIRNKLDLRSLFR
jgi:probable rRNA maturation factor